MQEIEKKWLERRQGGIGSSDSPPLVLGNVYDTHPIDVYIDKVSPIREQESKAHFRRGHTYEPLAITLYQEQTGIEVFSPKTDRERFNDFQLFHPDPSLHVFADLDAFCSDDWVLEAKCPTQRTFDKIVAEGLEDYYQVQSHHLAGVANEAELKFLGNERRKIKGTRVVVFAPEEVRIIVVEIPFNQEASDNVFDISSSWWRKHVSSQTPPSSPMEPGMALEKSGGDYVQTADAELEELVERLVMIKQFVKGAGARADKIKKKVTNRLDELERKKVLLPSGVKLLYDERSGQKRLDKKGLAAAHPEIDVDSFMVRGKPSRPFNMYGATQYGFDGGMSASDLAEELTNFPLRQLDPGVAEQEWNKLRAHAVAYLEAHDEGASSIRDAFEVANTVMGCLPD